MKLGTPLDRYQDFALSLRDLELKLGDFPLNLKKLQYECYTSDNSYPCTFTDFAHQRSKEYGNFLAESKKFLAKIDFSDDGRCFVLEFEEMENIVPYLFCVKSQNTKEARNLIKSLRDAYSELV